MLVGHNFTDLFHFVLLFFPQDKETAYLPIYCSPKCFHIWGLVKAKDRNSTQVSHMSHRNPNTRSIHHHCLPAFALAENASQEWMWLLNQESSMEKSAFYPLGQTHSFYKLYSNIVHLLYIPSYHFLLGHETVESQVTCWRFLTCKCRSWTMNPGLWHHILWTVLCFLPGTSFTSMQLSMWSWGTAVCIFFTSALVILSLNFSPCFSFPPSPGCSVD